MTLFPDDLKLKIFKCSYLSDLKIYATMKKLLLLFLAFCANIAYSAQMRHFNMEIKESNSIEQVVSHFAEWFNLPDNSSFIQSKATNDNNGGKHYCYEQYVNGIKVEGGQILVHSYAGKVSDVNGVVLEKGLEQFPIRNNILKKSKNDSIGGVVIIPDNNTVFRYAHKFISEELGAYVYVDVENNDTLNIIPFIHDIQTSFTTNTLYYGRQRLTVNASGQWRYYSVQDPRIETISSTGQSLVGASASTYNTLIQLCNTYCEKETDSLNSYISSINFKITNPDWYRDLEEGVGKNVNPDLYIKITDSSGSIVYQSDVIDDWEYINATFNPMLLLDGSTYTIKLYDEDVVSDDYGGGFTISTTTKGIGTLTTSNFEVTINITGNPLRDAHWGMEKTLAYYSNVLHRNSYDDNGAVVYQFINPFKPDNLPCNAFARTEAPYCMIYGLGDGVTFSPVVSLDVMAHEFSHMVTSHNICNGLNYEGESGALNEGFSDIFGELVEGYTLGQYDWTIAEKVTLLSPYLRSLKAPKTGSPAQPTTYGVYPWLEPSNKTKENDFGGVHTNSSILSYWFYLLCNGGSGVNDNNQSYNVKGIGITKATEIVYNTWMNRLTFRSTFADARESFIKEVISNPKYGKGSQEHQSVVNAWYAVGVGEKYVDTTTFPSPGNYVIVANRNLDGDKNWYYMTSDLGTASTKRFQAVSTGVLDINAVAVTDLEDKYVWTLEADGANWKLKNGTQYITWASGNSANLASIGKSLTLDAENNKAKVHFNDGTAERYLSLHSSSTNNYFAFYANTGQIEDLYFLPCDGANIPVESKKYIVLAQRDASSNWFYMTSDLGTASTKRYQAIDAGTSTLSDVNNSSLEDKYYWEMEGNKLKTAAGYSTWISGNSANLNTTGKELNIQKQTDGTYTFSFADGDNTRYLSLNKTAGNNYFAYYNGTGQIYKLTLVKEGERGTATGIDIMPASNETAHKILRNGQIFIIRGGKTYTITGQEVK